MFGLKPRCISVRPCGIFACLRRQRGRPVRNEKLGLAGCRRTDAAIAEGHEDIFRGNLTSRDRAVGKLRGEAIVKQEASRSLLRNRFCLLANARTCLHDEAIAVSRPGKAVDIVGQGRCPMRWISACWIGNPYLRRTIDALEIADARPIRRPAGRIGPVPATHDRRKIAERKVIPDKLTASVDFGFSLASIHRGHHEPQAIRIGLRVCALHNKSDPFAIG